MSSLYSLTGAAAFHAARPPRDSVVEFSGGRTVTMPMAAAIPVLSKAHRREDLHPSVALLSGAVMLGLRLVAAGRIEPGEGSEPGWRAVVEGDDVDRVLMLAGSRAYAEVGPHVGDRADHGPAGRGLPRGAVAGQRVHHHELVDQIPQLVADRLDHCADGGLLVAGRHDDRDALVALGRDDPVERPVLGGRRPSLEPVPRAGVHQAGSCRMASGSR